MKTLCIAYMIALTLLLVASDPFWFLGGESASLSFLSSLVPIAHLLGFGVLALLALAAQWPLPRWTVVLYLLAYSGGTELVQVFVPGRAPEWGDWLQDLAGVALAVAICWPTAVAWRYARSRSESGQPAISDELETFLKVRANRPTGDHSWWR